MKTCVCAASLIGLMGAGASAQLDTELFASGLSSPVFATHAGDGSGRLFVLEQRGRVRIIDADGTLRPEPFLDIDALVTDRLGEMGLLGLAFHPDFASNGRFYVCYIGDDIDTRVAEYRVSDDDPDLADAGSARLLMRYDQPAYNHNGGWIGFSPSDGRLYISAGDGGGQNDPNNLAGDLGSYHGKIHRIDVDGGDDFPDDDDQNYAIPSDNPFVGVAGALESIWAYGLRNPWRASFDRDTGDLWIGDVGQWTYEEVNHQPAGSGGGEHYGWRCREGLHATGQSCGTASGFTDPVHEYTHVAGGCSITGGYAYRGCALGEDYKGLYFFSDYCSGKLWTLDPANGYASTLEIDLSFFVSAFGEDEDGELYVVDINGSIHKLVNPSEPGACDDACPADLTGDGELDFFDVSAFLSGFTSQDPASDFTGDGAYDFFDVSAFLGAFAGGCP